MISNKKQKIKAAITAVGGYVPEDFISNKDLEKTVNTTDDWITARTGIKRRRILKKDGKATSYLAIMAAKDLLNKSDIDPADIDLVILSTITPDYHVASTAPTVATEIKAINAEITTSSIVAGSLSTISSETGLLNW